MSSPNQPSTPEETASGLVSAHELYTSAAALLLAQGDNDVDGTYLFLPDPTYVHVKLTDYSSNAHVAYRYDPATEDPGPAKRLILETGDPILQVQPTTAPEGMSRDIWMFRPISIRPTHGIGQLVLRGVPDSHNPEEPIILADGRSITDNIEHPFLNLLLPPTKR